jgi:exodeoxyribonuclease V alpha subunit
MLVPMDSSTSEQSVVRLHGYITAFKCKRPEGNGFAVARFRIKDDEGRQHQETTVVGGGLCEFTERDPLDLRGVWEESKFGRQLRVTHAFRSKPANGSEWVTYLVQYISGIGPSRAKAMVKAFGDKLEETLDRHPEMLFDMPGMPKKTAEKILASWNDDRANRGVGLVLAELGLSGAIGRRVIEYFGSATETIVRQNPYKLIEVPGIGFRRADDIARHFGVRVDSPERSRAAILFVLEEEASDSGHVFVPLGRLLDRAEKDCEVKRELVKEQLPKMLRTTDTEHTYSIVQEEIPQANGLPSVPVLYLKHLHRAEVRLSKSIRRLLTAHPTIQHSTMAIEAALEHSQQDKGVTLNAEQRMAIRNAVTLCLSIVTGKAGTGKTTTLQILVKVAEMLNIRFSLAAPTGRAAKRMTEVTDQPATTIHRLLEFNPEVNGFLRNRMNPLDADLVIIDEFSMVDLKLAADLFDAIRAGTSVLVLGDPNQLMSVGAGRVLADMIDSGKIPRTDLHQIFRQAQQSLIVTNAHKVLNGTLPVFHRDEVREGTLSYDCYNVPAPAKPVKGEKGTDPVQLMEILTDFSTQKIPKRMQFDPIRDLQVLVPQKKGAVGVHEVNRHLQNVLNPRKEFERVLVNGREFRVGDRVMQMKNNHKLEVYNGDIGFVESFDREDKVLVVQFPTRRLEYQFKDTDELQLAYAISIHKSQGSEFKVVIMLLLTDHWIMLQRNLLYTAMTRSKKLLLVISQPRALFQAVTNNEAQVRNSSLIRRIKSAPDGKKPGKEEAA